MYFIFIYVICFLRIKVSNSEIWRRWMLNICAKFHEIGQPLFEKLQRAYERTNQQTNTTDHNSSRRSCLYYQTSRSTSRDQRLIVSVLKFSLALLDLVPSGRLSRLPVCVF